MKKMNLPNKLTVLRMIMVPIFVVVMMASNALWADLVGLFLFAAASITDMLDGKIARRYNLVTDFGKFMDPLADKFMVIGAMMVILYKNLTAETPNRWFGILFFCALMIVVFRELAVTAMRLVVSGSSGIVVAANMLGKIKTVSQIVFVIATLIEPLIYPTAEVIVQVVPMTWLACLSDILPLTLASGIVMAFFTVWSGIHYIVSLWKYIETK